MAEKKTLDWLAIEGAYRAGGMSLRAIADRYGCSETLIRKAARKNGWIQNPEGQKREIVRQLMTGIPSGGCAQEGSQRAHLEIARQAEQDASDMGDSLALARKCIYKLSQMVDATDNPKDVKIVAEANKIAMETIRRIRGLDDPAPPNPDDKTLTINVKRLTVER